MASWRTPAATRPHPPTLGDRVRASTGHQGSKAPKEKQKSSRRPSGHAVTRPSDLGGGLAAATTPGRPPGPRTWARKVGWPRPPPPDGHPALGLGRGRGRPAPAEVRGPLPKVTRPSVLVGLRPAAGRPGIEAFTPRERGRPPGDRNFLRPKAGPPPRRPPKAGGWPPQPGATEASSARGPRARLPGTRSLEIGNAPQPPLRTTPGHPSKSKPQPKPSTGAREDVPNTHPKYPHPPLGALGPVPTDKSRQHGLTLNSS